MQLKATTNIVPKNGKIYYDLEVKNYNDLIRENIGTQRILILYAMPKDRDLWLEHLEKILLYVNAHGGARCVENQRVKIREK